MYFDAFVDVLPGVSNETLHRLFSFMVVLMVTAPADSSYHSLSGQPAWPKNPQKLADDLVDFVVAGFAVHAPTARTTTGRRGKRRAAATTGSR
jgi:hypothetical protein